MLLEPSAGSARNKYVTAVKLWGSQRIGTIDLAQKMVRIRQSWGSPVRDSCSVAATDLQVMSYRRDGFEYRFYYHRGDETVVFLEIMTAKSSNC